MPFGSVSICIDPHHFPYHYKNIDKFIHEMGHQALHEPAKLKRFVQETMYFSTVGECIHKQEE